VLVLADENQGVCSWGVPLDGDRGPVLVGGELLDAGNSTVRYAASVEDFIAARRWDRRCLDAGPLLQAQAPELDQASLGHLQSLLSPAVSTAGWPGSRQYRFEGLGVRVLLWSAAGQCDWWISATGEDSLRAFTAGLLELPGLREALWSNDDAGARLLTELLRAGRLFTAHEGCAGDVAGQSGHIAARPAGFPSWWMSGYTRVYPDIHYLRNPGRMRA